MPFRCALGDDRPSSENEPGSDDAPRENQFGEENYHWPHEGDAQDECGDDDDAESKAGKSTVSRAGRYAVRRVEVWASEAAPPWKLHELSLHLPDPARRFSDDHNAILTRALPAQGALRRAHSP